MKRASVAALILVFVAAFAYAKSPSNPYPNELRGFKLYVRYLAPLRSYVSDEASVVQVLGSLQGKELSGWRIRPLVLGTGATVNGHPWLKDVSGRLDHITVIPKQRISLLGVRFSTAFKHSMGSLSEVNVVCDIYSDDFGLQYWVYAEDASVGRKGDLMYIVYGPSKQMEKQVVGP